MTLAFGNLSSVIGEWEDTYGTLPSSTGWKLLPVVAYDPGIQQPWERMDIAGLAGGRDEPDPMRGLLTVEPSAEVPVDLVHIGFWLRLLFGEPTTTGDSDYVHVFKSGAAELPSIALEHGNSAVTNGYQRVLGARGASLALTFRPGEALQTASVGMIATSAPARASSSADSSPIVNAWTPFSGAVMTALRAGSALGKVTGAQLRFANGLEALRAANRSDAAISEAEPGNTEVTGRVDIRLADETLLADSEGASPVALSFGYAISAAKSLTFEVPEARLNRIGVGVRGRGGIQQSFAFRGAFNASAAASLVATLKNQLSGYH